MKRIAAPMVGGLVTSAFLTLEIIPAIVTYWRYEQLLWEKLARIDPESLAALKRWTSSSRRAARWSRPPSSPGCTSRYPDASSRLPRRCVSSCFFGE